MEVAGRICRQLTWIAALQLQSRDASEFDQTDRDLARALVVPSADAEGYTFDSNRNSVDRAAAVGQRQGAGRQSIKTRSETCCAVAKCRQIDGFKNRRSPVKLSANSIA